MPKNVSAIAALSGAENAGLEGADLENALSTIKGIMDGCAMGTELTDEQYAAVKEALPAIGCTNTSVSSDGAFQGGDVVEYQAEGAGITVKMSANLECKGDVLNNARMGWTIDGTFEKVAGDARVQEIKCDYYYLSLGNSAIADKPKVLFNYTYSRTFRDDQLTRAFDEGKAVSASHVDHNANWQWGFFMMLKVTITTDQGTFVV